MRHICISAVFLLSIIAFSLIGCSQNPAGTVSDAEIVTASDTEITTISAFDIPADPRPYYEQMQIRQPMPRPDGQPMLYPLSRRDISCISAGESRWFCYIINESGEIVIPVGTYRDADYIYDDDGVEKYLLCSKSRTIDEKNDDFYVQYPDWDSDYSYEDYISSGQYHKGVYGNQFEYDIIDFSGKIITSFNGYGAYPFAYGSYVAIEQLPWEWGNEDPHLLAYYDVDKRKTIFKYPGWVYMPKLGVWVVTTWEGNSRGFYYYNPATKQLLPVPEEEERSWYRYWDSYWNYPEERCIIVVDENEYEHERLLVCGSYYFDSDGNFLGYKDKSGEWVYRDILEQSGVSGVSGYDRYRWLI